MKQAIVLVALLTAAAGAHARPVTVTRNSSALDFTYSWPAQAAAIPALDRRFRTEMAAAYRRQLKLARADQQSYREQGRAGVRDFYAMKWTTAGQSPRLLSLQYQHSAYTGGAHPNTDYGALLWDRRAGRQVSVVSLFARAGSLGTLTRAAYCKALDAERLTRREGAKLGGEFDACPKLTDLAIAPLDRDKDGRFEALEFVASPYTAGPYSEGAYAIPVRVSRQLLAALKPAYRASFEAQRQ